MTNRRTALWLAVVTMLCGPNSMAASPNRQRGPARVAVLGGGSPEGTGYLIDAFQKGMRELGYVEGGNVLFELRYAYGKMERLPGLAMELVRLEPDVIFATNTAPARAAQQASATIPIVVGTGDPVSAGLAKSLAYPGGNVTGLSGLNVDVGPKLLEMLLTSGPDLSLSRIANLGNPTNPNFVATLAGVRAAALVVGVEILSFEAKSPPEIDDAFSQIRLSGVRAVIVQGDAMFILQRQQIAKLAADGRLLSAFSYREHVESGGLMSYGENLVKRFQLAASYVDRILKGAKPADLPIEQATTFELVINLKTAKSLGLKIPNSVLLRADEVIQ
jgi:putative ABC transport system substrate-binding protein